MNMLNELFGSVNIPNSIPDKTRYITFWASDRTIHCLLAHQNQLPRPKYVHSACVPASDRVNMEGGEGHVWAISREGC